MTVLFPRADALLKRFPNVYILIHAAAKRARQLQGGVKPLIDLNYLRRRFSNVEQMNREWGTDFSSFQEVLQSKPLTLAFLEIAEGLVDIGELK